MDKNNRIVQKNYLSNQPVLAENNARQFLTLRHCNDWPDIDKKTDFLVRVREDVFIVKMELDTVLTVLEGAASTGRGAVVTSKCDAWRGINDKIGFASSDRARDFFLKPYQEYLIFDNKHFGVHKLNAETFYRLIYIKHGFNLHSTHALLATKAKTSFVGVDPMTPGRGENCTVIANPFMAMSTLCPQRSMEELSYRSTCWD